jgi:hypothetical protein
MKYKLILIFGCLSHKTEKTEYSTGRTIIIVLGCFLAFLIVIGISNFSFDPLGGANGI